MRRLSLLAALPAFVVALFLGGAVADRLTHHVKPQVQVVDRPVIPQSVIRFAAKWQSVWAFDKAGVGLQRIQVNAVSELHGRYLANLTVVMPGQFGQQYAAELDKRTLKIKSLRAFNGSA